MRVAQLKSLLKHGESELLEFKNSTASLIKGIQTVCAFLNNDHGGTVIFGIKDNGQIVGQTVTDKTRKEIAIELSKIEPYAKIEVKYLRVLGNLFVILLIVNPGEKAPYTYDGRSFIRNQSTTMRMTKEEYIYLYNKKNPTLWENLTNKEIKITDLDRNRIKEVVRMAVFEKRLPESASFESIPEILKKMGLIIDDKITNAGIILFGKNENKKLIQSNIQIARFKGLNKNAFVNSKYYKSNAFDLYDKAMEFLDFNLPVAAYIEDNNPNRVEIPAIPYKVLREAITNALVHRDYSNLGGSISIALYDDRLNISNIGALPQGIKINHLSREHRSIQRNPVIAHVFYLCGKVEKWGRGTLDMIQKCKEVGNPLPIFEEIGGSFSITFPLKRPLRDITYINDNALTVNQKNVLKSLKKGPLKKKEILKKINSKINSRIIQTELIKLKQIGLIKSEGKTKCLVWALNYEEAI